MPSTETWHLSRAISVSHLVTTFALVLSGVIYITSIEQDVAVLDTRISNIEVQLEILDTEHKQMFEKIDDKLDTLMAQILNLHTQ